MSLGSVGGCWNGRKWEGGGWWHGWYLVLGTAILTVSFKLCEIIVKGCHLSFFFVYLSIALINFAFAPVVIGP